MTTSHSQAVNNVTVLGLSKSGVAVSRHAARHGGSVLLSEARQATDEDASTIAELQKLGVTVETGLHSEAILTHAPMVVTSPGIPPTAPVFQHLERANVPVISEPEYAWRALQQFKSRHNKAIKTIGITGTNGKSTVTALTAHLLNTAGLTAPACGNIGLPFTQALCDTTDEATRDPADAFVVELSSFQLHHSPTMAVDVSVFLNLTPDHIDWHGTMTAYRLAKARLFQNQTPGQVAVLNADDPVSQELAALSQATWWWFGLSQGKVKTADVAAYRSEDGRLMLRDGLAEPLQMCHVDELNIKGEHNHSNALAAMLAAYAAGAPVELIRKGLLSFTSLPHRLQYVATVQGVDYYNDSKATNVESALLALQAFAPRQVVWLAGGKDKGTDLAQLAQVASQYAACAVLYGAARERFAAALRPSMGDARVVMVETLEQAIEAARPLASSTVPVVLSPACASFDQFVSFEHRGEVFMQLVQDLSPNTSNNALHHESNNVSHNDSQTSPQQTVVMSASAADESAGA